MGGLIDRDRYETFGGATNSGAVSQSVSATRRPEVEMSEYEFRQRRIRCPPVPPAPANERRARSLEARSWQGLHRHALMTMCQFSFCILPHSSGVMIPKTFLKLCPPLYTRWNFFLAGLKLQGIFRETVSLLTAFSATQSVSASATQAWRSDERLISRNHRARWRHRKVQRCTVGYRRGLAGRRGSGTTPHGQVRYRSRTTEQRGLSTSIRAALGRDFLLGLDGCNGVSRLLLRLREFPDLAL